MTLTIIFAAFCLLYFVIANLIGEKLRHARRQSIEETRPEPEKLPRGYSHRAYDRETGTFVGTIANDASHASTGDGGSHSGGSDGGSCGDGGSGGCH